MTALNRDDIVDALAKRTSTTKAAARAAVVEIFDIITEGLKTQGEVSIHGFGKITSEKKPERQGRNPRTGEAITIAAHNKVSFSPSKTLVDAVQ